MTFNTMPPLSSGWGDIRGPSSPITTTRPPSLVPTVLRGNAVFDAPRRPCRGSSGEDAERPGRHSHAERGNEFRPKGTLGPIRNRHGPQSVSALGSLHFWLFAWDFRLFFPDRLSVVRSEERRVGKEC